MKEFFIFIWGFFIGGILMGAILVHDGYNIDLDLMVKSVDEDYILLNNGFLYIPYQEGVSINDTFRIVKVSE